MRKLLLLLFIPALCFGQSKKQQIAELQSRLVQSQLNESSLIENIKQLVSEYELLNSEKEHLNNKLTEETEEKDRLNSQLETTQNQLNSLSTKLSELEQELNFKNDSLSLIKMELEEINSVELEEINSKISRTKTEDFLNNYALTRQPLNSNSFIWELEKIVTYQDDDNDSYYNLKAQSVIDINNFYLEYVRDGINLSRVDAKSLTIRKPISFLSTRMPQIEVLKNKLVTIKYKSGEEENLLFNLRSETNEIDENLRVTLASEETQSSEDIIWNIRQINNEYYIALNYSQLKRLKLPLDNRRDYIYFFTEKRYRNREDFSSERIEYLPTSNKTKRAIETLWLVQKKNKNIEYNMKIDPNKCVYLFKLVEQ